MSPMHESRDDAGSQPPEERCQVGEYYTFGLAGTCIFTKRLAGTGTAKAERPGAEEAQP